MNACSSVAWRRLLALLVSGLLALAFLLWLNGAVLAGPDDPPPMDTARDRLAPPSMSDPPTLVEQGHYNYYLSCMVCHGDRGQGLTEEWRNAGDPADANCWQSHCHAANHPPEGFVLPRYAPPLIGVGTLSRFQTVGQLHGYIQSAMPWQMPGSLDDEVYWQLAAFLAATHGVPGINTVSSWAELAAKPLSARTSISTTALTTLQQARPAAMVAPLTSKVAGAEVKDNHESWPRAGLVLFGVAVLVVGGAAWRHWSQRKAQMT